MRDRLNHETLDIANDHHPGYFQSFFFHAWLMRLEFHRHVASDISGIMDYYEAVAGAKLADEFYVSQSAKRTDDSSPAVHCWDKKSEGFVVREADG